MDVMEKLVELIANAKAMYADDYTDHTEDEYIAETLLDNFITVWDGKPIEAFLHPIDSYKGLKAKYLVFKADTGEMVDNCFILRPDKDAVAVEALRAYAKVTDNETLAKDIYNWVGNGVTVQDNTEISDELLERLRKAPVTVMTEEPTVEVVQEWISVKDRLPEHGDVVLCFMKFGEQRILQWDKVSSLWLGYGHGDDWQKADVTHWCCLPQPPKGE